MSEREGERGFEDGYYGQRPLPALHIRAYWEGYWAGCRERRDEDAALDALCRAAEAAGEPNVRAEATR